MRSVQLVVPNSNAMAWSMIFSLPIPMPPRSVTSSKWTRHNGERTIFYMPKRYKLLKPGDIPLEAVRRAKLVLVDGIERDAVPMLLEAARSVGVRSVLDIEEGSPEEGWRLLKLSTDCILPFGHARFLSGKKSAEQTLRSLAKETSAQLIVTDGAYGAGLLGGLTLRCRMELAVWVAAQVARGLGRSNLPSRESLRQIDCSVFSSELRTGLPSPLWDSPQNVH